MPSCGPCIGGCTRRSQRWLGRTTFPRWARRPASPRPARLTTCRSPDRPSLTSARLGRALATARTARSDRPRVRGVGGLPPGRGIRDPRRLARAGAGVHEDLGAVLAAAALHPITPGTADHEDWGDRLTTGPVTEASGIENPQIILSGWSDGFPNHFFVIAEDPLPENPRVHTTDHEDYVAEAEERGTLEQLLHELRTELEFEAAAQEFLRVLS